MKQRYECDKCGACCKELIIEIGWIDVLREPKLRDVSTPFRLYPGQQFLDENDELIEDPDPYMAGAMLACGANKPCQLLNGDNTCSIYPTRPLDCVAMQAGDEQCQRSRGMAGLPPLQPLLQPTENPLP